MLDLWWREVLVGNEPARHDRLRITLAAAGEVVRAPSGLFQLPLEANGAIIDDLQGDGVLLLDSDADRYRFGHDVIQDWAVVRWLENDPDSQLDRLRSTSSTPGFYRAVNVFAQRLAERDRGRYDVLADALASGDDQRGEHAFTAALVLSPHAPRLLASRAASLLDKEGAPRLLAARRHDRSKLTLTCVAWSMPVALA